MVTIAVEADGAQVKEIAARAGLFNQEEIDTVAALWEDYLNDGPIIGGYNFLVYKEKDQVLGFSCYGPRDLTTGVFDLYWIAVDSSLHRKGIGRHLLVATEEQVHLAKGRMLIAETSGTPHYEPTRNFYYGMGYALEASIKDFYSVGDDLAIFIKRF